MGRPPRFKARLRIGAADCENTIKRQPATSGRLPSVLLILHRVRHQILFHHESHLKHDSVVKFAQVESCQPLDFFQAVDEGVAMDKEFPGRLRDIQVVFKEALDGKEGFLIERVDGALLEHLAQEHLAQGGG